MPTDIIMPKLGLTMEEGTIVRWHAAAGDRVAQGQALLEVETDKVTVEVEAQATGIMEAPLVGEGQKAPVGALLGRILAEDEILRSAQNDSQNERIFSSPRARRRARERGLDWRVVTGSGPRGRVIERDVLRAAVARPPVSAMPAPPAIPPASLPPAIPPVRGEEVRWEMPGATQRITAERMTASFGSAPHFYLNVEVLADALLELRERLLPAIERKTGVRLTVTDLLIRIAGAALAEHPRANAFWEDGRIGVHQRINVGIAVAADASTSLSTGAGLIVPVIRDADRKSLAQIAAERTGLIERARAGRLTPDDLAGGTFTLTNLGMYRVDSFQAILNPPQAAILAVGRIAERPVAIGGQLAVRQTVVLTLACDHRVLDGVLAARFLGRVAELIEEPYELFV